MEENIPIMIRIPDTGSIHDAVHIISEHKLNISRVHFDRCVDHVTVFFSVTGEQDSGRRALEELRKSGYLEPNSNSPKTIQFSLSLPNQCGLLHDFLELTDATNTLVTKLDFDERGKDPDHLIATVRCADQKQTEKLISEVESRFCVLEYALLDSDKGCNRFAFYDRYADLLKYITSGSGSSDELVLSDLIYNFNHIAQALSHYGRDFSDVFEKVLENGKRLQETCGNGFYADVQIHEIEDKLKLYCFQVPCGGNIFLIESDDEVVMIDTGYGIYHEDVMKMFEKFGFGPEPKFSRIILTHGDTDHCGASGFFDAPVYTHKGTGEIIKTNNRATGSVNEGWVLEEIYTLMINLFARMNPAQDLIYFPENSTEMCGDFNVLDSFKLGDYKFEVLESHGGHQHGLVYVMCREAGLLFTSDTVLNLKYLTPERTEYNAFAVYLVTSVNVDPNLVKSERKAMLKLAHKVDHELKTEGKQLLICCGHGPVSMFEDNELVPYGEIEHYSP